MSDERKIASDRYRKRNAVYLDFDGSKYSNSYSLGDGDMPTGITVCDTGDSAKPSSNVRTVMFRGEEYPSLKAAVIAYEDSLEGAK